MAFYMLFQWSGAMKNGSMSYFCKWVLDNTFFGTADAWGASQGLLSIMGAIPMAVAAVFVVPLANKFGKRLVCGGFMLLGAVGGPKWEGLPGEQRPEKGLLRLRAGMGLYSNNRPARIWPQLAPASPLKPEIVAKGIDFIIVRELIGGVYFGEHKTIEQNGEKVAIDTMPYSEHEIERIGRIGFETAMKRRRKLCCVDKANVLDTSRLWRSVMHRLQAEYPDVEYSEMFVDNCAMQIVKNPRSSMSSSPRICSVTSSPMSLHDHRLHRHDPVLLFGRWHPGPVRAHSRLGPRHCGKGYRQPHRLHPLCRHDAALLLWHD